MFDDSESGPGQRTGPGTVSDKLRDAKRGDVNY